MIIKTWHVPNTENTLQLAIIIIIIIIIIITTTIIIIIIIIIYCNLVFIRWQ